MTISLQKIEQRMARFKTMCRDSGVKMTHQRIEIFREVAQTGEHPDAERVFRGVRQRVPTVSQDTVYRTLWLLNDLGLIQTLGPPRERTRFDANLNHHHHFVCVQCGLTRDFYYDVSKGLKLPEAIKSFGHVKTTSVEVRGVCAECSSKGES